MIPADKLLRVNLKPGGGLDQLPVNELQSFFDTKKLPNGNRVRRAPILTADNTFEAVVHKATFDEMIADDMEINTADRATVLAKPLKDLLGLVWDSDTNQSYRVYVTSSIAFASESLSLAEADARRRQVSGCSDVMVTSTGDRTGRLIGWLTEDELAAR